MVIKKLSERLSEAIKIVLYDIHSFNIRLIQFILNYYHVIMEMERSKKVISMIMKTKRSKISYFRQWKHGDLK